MVLKLETGKFYKTRDGQKVGPMLFRRDCDDYAVDGFEGPYGNAWWSENGIRGGMGDIHDGDIVAEWKESPVRTVTRKEIASGTYGRLYVAKQGGTEPRLLINLADEAGVSRGVSHGWSVDELRNAIGVLTEIADALEQTP
jgi:hypothetical protein